MQHPIAVLLAGGEGKRFTPFVSNKTLVPFLGKSLIFHTIDTVLSSGIRDVVIVGSAKNAEIIASYTHPNLNLQFVLQDSPLGMADALLHAEKVVADRPMIVIDAAKVFDEQALKDLVEKGSQPDTDAVVLARKVEQYFPGGYLKVQGERAIAIIEKPPKDKLPSDFVTIVCHYFAQPALLFSALRDIGSSERDDQYERALSQLMSTHHVKFLEYLGQYRSLKYAHDVVDLTQTLLAQKLTKTYISKKAEVSSAAVLEGIVHIEDGAVIHAGAVLHGPVYIGRNVIVGNNTLIRNSIVEEGSVIGFGSEVARSYVGPNCKLHHAFAGDSALESNVNASWGTCLANFRMDKQHILMKNSLGKHETGKRKLGAIIGDGAFLGINVAVMPGTSIEANSKILPGSIVK